MINSLYSNSRDFTDYESNAYDNSLNTLYKPVDEVDSMIKKVIIEREDKDYFLNLDCYLNEVNRQHKAMLCHHQEICSDDPFTYFSDEQIVLTNKKEGDDNGKCSG